MSDRQKLMVQIADRTANLNDEALTVLANMALALEAEEHFGQVTGK